MAHEFLKDVSAAAETAFPIEVGKRYQRIGYPNISSEVYGIEPADESGLRKVLLHKFYDEKVSGRDYCYTTNFSQLYAPMATDASARLEKATKLLRRVAPIAEVMPLLHDEITAFLAEGSK